MDILEQKFIQTWLLRRTKRYTEALREAREKIRAEQGWMPDLDKTANQKLKAYQAIFLQFAEEFVAEVGKAAHNPVLFQLGRKCILDFAEHWIGSLLPPTPNFHFHRSAPTKTKEFGDKIIYDLRMYFDESILRLRLASTAKDVVQEQNKRVDVRAAPLSALSREEINRLYSERVANWPSDMPFPNREDDLTCRAWLAQEHDGWRSCEWLIGFWIFYPANWRLSLSGKTGAVDS